MIFTADHTLADIRREREAREAAAGYLNPDLIEVTELTLGDLLDALEAGDVNLTNITARA